MKADLELESRIRGVLWSYKRAIDGFVGMLPEGIPCLQQAWDEAVAISLGSFLMCILRLASCMKMPSSPYLTDAHF
jgi:hypothetical protein